MNPRAMSEWIVPAASGAVWPVLDRDQRLRRQGLELARQVGRIVGERRPRIRVGEDNAQLPDLRPQLGITRLRLLLDTLEAALDVVSVGDEQLELQVLEI